MVSVPIAGLKRWTEMELAAYQIAIYRPAPSLGVSPAPDL